jgi:hypothetical protein
MYSQKWSNKRQKLSKILPYSKKKSTPKYGARKKAKIWTKYYPIVREKVLPKMELEKRQKFGQNITL